MLLTAVIIYLILTIAIGVAASRLIDTSKDYMVAGRNLPMALSTAALFALWFGSETVFGASSEFVEHGLRGVIEDPFGGVLCLLLFALVFARPLYRMNILTLGDLFRQQYGARVELIASVFMVITFFGYIAAQLVALGIILQIISGLSLSACIIISAFIVTLYTLAGGMWAISITDFMQSIVIVAGLAAIVWSVSEAGGGAAKILEAAPEDAYRFFPEAGFSEWIHWIAAWMVLGFGSLASQDIFQRVNSCKTETIAVRSTIFGAIIYLVIALLPLYLGLAARVLYADEISGMDYQLVLPFMALKHSGIWVQILFFGALLSAIFSTCSGAILAPASIIAENIIKPHLKKEWSDAKFLFMLRICVALMALVATIMALGRSNIYQLVAESSILGLVTLLVPMFCAVYWKKATPLGAIMSMFFGLIIWFVFEHLLEINFPALMAGFGCSIAGILIGTKLFK